MQPTNERDEFVHGIFTTAMEGGVQYWAEVQRYRWCVNGNTSNPDYRFFRAVLRSFSSSTERPSRRGWSAWPSHLTRSSTSRSSSPIADLCEQARLDDAVGEIDADLADCIVQAGLFAEVRYG